MAILYSLKAHLELFELTKSKISATADYGIPFPFTKKQKRKWKTHRF